MMTTQKIQDAFLDGTQEERVAAARNIMLYLDEYLPWFAARELTSMKAQRKDDVWLVIVTAKNKRKHEVCFATGWNLEEAYMELAYKLIFSLAAWKPDKFRSTRNGKS